MVATRRDPGCSFLWFSLTHLASNGWPSERWAVQRTWSAPPFRAAAAAASIPHSAFSPWRFRQFISFHEKVRRSFIGFALPRPRTQSLQLRRTRLKFVIRNYSTEAPFIPSREKRVSDEMAQGLPSRSASSSVSHKMAAKDIFCSSVNAIAIYRSLSSAELQRKNLATFGAPQILLLPIKDFVRWQNKKTNFLKVWLTD